MTDGPAQLPQRYEHARTALAECVRIDECKSWADKAAAIASYARQAKDDTLKNDALRIQRRAEYRMGELLREIEPGKTGPKPELHDGCVTQLSRRKAAEDAGLSERQRNDAIAIAGIPEREFDDLIETGEVPTKAALVELARGRPHVTNNSGLNEWYTPPEYIECARAVMRGIDLDPASSDAAQQTVRAGQYFTADDDGLTREWFGRVWLNPPYSSDFVAKFCEKLAAHIDDGSVTDAVLLVNNATETRWFQDVAARCSALCFPLGRIRYLSPDGLTKNSPLQGQCFLYFGRATQDFCKVFSELGLVVVPNG